MLRVPDMARHQSRPGEDIVLIKRQLFEEAARPGSCPGVREAPNHGGVRCGLLPGHILEEG
jgi:hypothetical protein